MNIYMGVTLNYMLQLGQQEIVEEIIKQGQFAEVDGIQFIVIKPIV